MRDKNKVTRTRKFCPGCGSEDIVKENGAYRCINCGALFRKPRTTEIKVRKSPRYIG